jgi:hypothetical protein
MTKLKSMSTKVDHAVARLDSIPLSKRLRAALEGAADTLAIFAEAEDKPDPLWMLQQDGKDEFAFHADDKAEADAKAKQWADFNKKDASKVTVVEAPADTPKDKIHNENVVEPNKSSASVLVKAAGKLAKGMKAVLALRGAGDSAWFQAMELNTSLINNPDPKVAAEAFKAFGVAQRYYLKAAEATEKVAAGEDDSNGAYKAFVAHLKGMAEGCEKTRAEIKSGAGGPTSGG